MADQPNRPAAPRVDIDQTEASVVERRRALRDAQRLFAAAEEERRAEVEGDLSVRFLSKVEEHPDYHATYEFVEVEPPASLLAFFFPLLPPWWRLMRIIFSGRKARVWQERITIDEIADYDIRVIKGNPRGPFDQKV